MHLVTGSSVLFMNFVEESCFRVKLVLYKLCFQVSRSVFLEARTHTAKGLIF